MTQEHIAGIRRHVIKLPVGLEGTLVKGKSQRRKGHLDKVFQVLLLSQSSKDPSGLQKLSQKWHLETIVKSQDNDANGVYITIGFVVISARQYNQITRQVLLKNAPFLLNLFNPLLSASTLK